MKRTYLKITDPRSCYPMGALLNYHGEEVPGYYTVSHLGNRKRFQLGTIAGEVVTADPNTETYTAFGFRYMNEPERLIKTGYTVSVTVDLHELPEAEQKAAWNNIMHSNRDGFQLEYNPQQNFVFHYHNPSRTPAELTAEALNIAKGGNANQTEGE